MQKDAFPLGSWVRIPGKYIGDCVCTGIHLFFLERGNFLFYFLLSDMLTALQEIVHTPRSGVGKDEITLGEVEQEATCCLIK